MTPSEIITVDCQRNNVDPQKIINYVGWLLQNKKAFLLHEFNSVLLAHILTKEDAELHLFTADQPLSVMKAVNKFIQQIKGTKLKNVYGKSDDPQVLEMLKRADVKVEKSNHPEFAWMAKV